MDEARRERDNATSAIHGHVSGGTVIQGRDIHLVAPEVHQVDWPIRIGAIPEESAHYQHRAIADQLNEALKGFESVAPRQVLSGTGGVGKTQIAAHFARTLANITDPDQRVDVLVWANATSRDQLTSVYAYAARQLFSIVPDSAEAAAQLFLTWLRDPGKHRNRRWLIVWDDLTDPAQVGDLWPPHDQPCGRVLVSTRRRDHSLTVQGRHIINVDVYTPEDAHSFLLRALGEAEIVHTPADLESLACALGHLPLALGQAVTYMAELGLGCIDYLDLIHNRMSTLDEMFPDWESPTPIAATWDLSLTQADSSHPKGIAQPLMGLIALLDGSGIPETVLTTQPVLAYLTAKRAENTNAETIATEISPTQVQAALATLRRWNLITRTSSSDKEHQNEAEQNLVGVHQLVQRATRERSKTAPTKQTSHAAANALVEEWERSEDISYLERKLHSNAFTLIESTGSWLWEDQVHPVIYHAGHSLGQTGSVMEAIDFWVNVASRTEHIFGTNHPETLTSERNLAHWSIIPKTPEAAKQYLEQLIAKHSEVLGPDNPSTLDLRGRLCFLEFSSGNQKAAMKGLQELLSDCTEFLGDDHHETLSMRHFIATFERDTGNHQKARVLFQNLAEDCQYSLGEHHINTLITRRNAADLQTDPRHALEALEQLLSEELATLGENHSEIHSIRLCISLKKAKNGNKTEALAEIKNLLDRSENALGKCHIDTINARHALATVSSDLGHKDEAVEELQKILACLARQNLSNNENNYTLSILNEIQELQQEDRN